MITAALIGFCGIILLIQGGGEAEPVGGRTLLGLLTIAATLFVYALAFERLGYVLSTLAMSAVVARLFGASWTQAGISGLILSVGSYLLFDHGLDVVLPAGILRGLI